jgi:hypothetical protein
VKKEKGKKSCEFCVFKNVECELGFEEKSCPTFEEKKETLYLSQYKIQGIFGMPFLAKLLEKAPGITLLFGKGKKVKCFSLREIEEEKHEA